jgi:hypothetical protein
MIFRKKLLDVKFVFWFCLQLLFGTFFILRRIQRDVVVKVKKSSRKVPIILTDFNETWIFFTDF